MAPRDLFDMNPVFSSARWEGYLAFVREQLGHYHVQDVDESEVVPGEDEEEEFFEAWGVNDVEEFEVYEDEEENQIQEIMEFLASLGPTVGTRENPIDLTMDTE